MKNVIIRLPFILFFMEVSLTTIETNACNLPDSVPKGWRTAANKPPDLVIGTDTSVKHSGRASGFIHRPRALKPSTGSGVLLQSIIAYPYKNKRVMLTVFVRSKEIEIAEIVGPFLYFRVDGQDSVLAYANTSAQKIEETTNWKLFHITLDVPETSVSMEFGVIFIGQGTLWLDDYKLETVELSIPSNDWLYKQKSKNPVSKKTYLPNVIAMNLGFEDR